MVPLKDRLTETDKAYLAGIFDGEGCVGYYKRIGSRSKYCYMGLVIISQSNELLMDWLKTKIGFGTIYCKPEKKHYSYSWESNKKADVNEFLVAIRPYLVLKAEQADVLLNHWKREGLLPYAKGKVTPEMMLEREKVYGELRAMKLNHLELVH